MNREELIDEALRLPTSAIPYYINKQLAILFPNQTVVECNEGYFDLAPYASNKNCSVVPENPMANELITGWEEAEEEEKISLSASGKLFTRAYNAWLDIHWRDETFKILTIHWQSGSSTTERHWLITDTEQTAYQFIETVCAWNAEIRGEILVFDDGCWSKDERLFQAIKKSTFDNLILQETLKQDILADLEHFFAARDIYSRYNIPWKRGILFVGSPGNGKTHTIKALINTLQKPCLYVKSFSASYGSEDSHISQVFARARKSAPCILVLEDLDSLLTDDNRSFFLNELDGFASNIGIVILATTNHPERLDPAIMDRPSRFDRKYPFDLPAVAEREKYIALWNNSLQAEMQISATAITHIAEQTPHFSFAYLKELFLSSIMKWLATSEKDMERVIIGQVELLQKQMVSNKTSLGSATAAKDETISS